MRNEDGPAWAGDSMRKSGVQLRDAKRAGETPRRVAPEECDRAHGLLTCKPVKIDADEAEERRQHPGEPQRPTDTGALLRSLLAGAWDAPPGNAASLVCLTGLDEGRWFPLVDGDNDIGRSEDVAVRIRDRAVSRRHARLRCTPEGYVLEDLRSPNGVYINGERLGGVQALEPGDVLELGHTVLRLNIPSETSLARSASGQSVVVTQKRRRERRTDWRLIGWGAVLAVMGGLVSWGLARWP